MSAEFAIIKLAHLGYSVDDLSLKEMREIERKHGRDWYERLGLEDNPLYINYELGIRKTRW
jgi:hypothetical protein